MKEGWKNISVHICFSTLVTKIEFFSRFLEIRISTLKFDICEGNVSWNICDLLFKTKTNICDWPNRRNNNNNNNNNNNSNNINNNNSELLNAQITSFYLSGRFHFLCLVHLHNRFFNQKIQKLYKLVFVLQLQYLIRFYCKNAYSLLLMLRTIRFTKKKPSLIPSTNLPHFLISL